MAAPIPYALLTDVKTYVGPAVPTQSDAELQRMLTRAIDLVNDVARSAWYQSDVDGNPTDAVVFAAFTKATCAQVEHWLGNGDEWAEMASWTTYSIGGVAVTRDLKEKIREARLCNEAMAALKAARLMPGWVAVT